MRIARFSLDGEVSFGVVEDGAGHGSDRAVATLQGHPFGPVALTGARHTLADVRLLPPVIPSKVVCIGKNYADHVAEMGGSVAATPPPPTLFLKPSTAVVGPGDPVVLPPSSNRVDFEGELAVVVGRLCKDVPADRALDVVLGYTCANDVTARDQQKADGQWTRAKGYDTFCPLGPWIETDLDPADLALRTEVDGEVRQQSRTSLLLHDVPALVAYVSAVMTLLPGDVLLTGTPAGVGPLTAGQVVSVTVEGIGTLRSPVVTRG